MDDTRDVARRFRSGRAAMHIGSLWALAIAGPIYDVLRLNAEFFVAYRADQRDLILFILAVSLVAPTALWALVWLISRLSATLARGALTTIVGLLVALLAAQALQALSPPTALHIGMAAGFGIVGAALYAFPAVRTFTTWLAPAIAVFPLVFLLDPAIGPMVWPTSVGAAVSAGPRTPTPIVFVVFDQLPLTSLVNPDGTIDRDTYPGFAELAATSTWYRNATTVGELTAWALPPILSGQYPQRGQLPTAADYPYNLFTALGQSYQMAVFEPITGLCPDSLCPPSASIQNAPTLAPMLADAAVVFAHRVTPAGLAGDLPPIDENWRGFIDRETFQQQWASERDRDRRRVLDNFLEEIDGGDADATLYFLHALLPHEPYEYLPSGQRSGLLRRLPGLRFGRWTKQEWPVAQGYARHLLQVGFVDRFVQRLIQHLRTEGLFDQALVVVTSDHGVSFVPDRSLKALGSDTAVHIMRVPLFVKRPMQPAGEVNDRNVQGIDVLPLVADILDVDLPFATDGRSPLDESVPALQTKTIVHAGGRTRMIVRVDELPQASDRAIQRVRWFGDGPGPPWSPIIAPAGNLRGQSIEGLRVEADPSLRITLDVADQVTNLNPDDMWIPAVISGRVRGSVGRSERVVLAIAINGRIEATTETYHGLPDMQTGTWSALVNPACYRKGFNDVRIYAVHDAGGRMRLVEGFRTNPP